VCFSNFQLGINYNQQPQSCTGNVTTTLEFIDANWCAPVGATGGDNGPLALT